MTALSKLALRKLGGIAALLCCAALPAVAHADPQSSRYTIEETSDGGFLRVDQQTGGILKCAGKEGTITCVPVNDDSQQLRQENEELKAENAKLKEKIAELESAIKRSDPADNSSAEKQLNQILGFFEDMVKRLFRFAQSLEDKPGENI